MWTVEPDPPALLEGDDAVLNAQQCSRSGRDGLHVFE